MGSPPDRNLLRLRLSPSSAQHRHYYAGCMKRNALKRMLQIPRFRARAVSHPNSTLYLFHLISGWNWRKLQLLVRRCQEAIRGIDVLRA